MALIGYPDQSHLPDAAGDILRTYPNNLVHMMTGLGPSFVPLMETISACVNSTSICPRLRELITLRVAARLKGTYVLHQHRSIAQQIGVSDDEINAACGVSPSRHLSNTENQVLLLVDELLVGSASEKMIIFVRNAIGDDGLHLVFLIFSLNRFLVIYSASLHIEMDAPIAIRGAGLARHEQSVTGSADDRTG